MSPFLSRARSYTPSHLLPVQDKEDISIFYWRSGLMIGMGYLLIMAFVIGGAWTLITQDWIHQQHTQEVELASLARAQDEHVSHTFGKASALLQKLSDTLTYSGEPRGVLINHLSEEAATGLLETPQIRQVSILNQTGSVILDRQNVVKSPLPALPTPSPDYWKGNLEAQLFIHPPAVDALNNWYIPVEHVLRDPDGHYAGSIFVLLSAAGFKTYFQETQLTPQDRLSMLSLNGRLLLHFPSSPDESLPDFGNILAQARLTNRQSTQFESAYEFGDEHRLGVIRVVRDLPIMVMVTRPMDIARAGFIAMRQRLLGGVITLGILLGLLSWLLYTDSRRHALTRHVLRRLNASLSERISRRTAELEQSNQELLAFSYSISHDLRAPLRAINGFAHALREDYGEKLDEPGRDYLDRIYRASVRMGELIDELLALANVSRTPLNIRDIDITHLAQDIIADLRINSPGRNVQFDAQENMHVEGDEALIGNALSNLLHNAWKFTRGRSPAIITLSAVSDGEFTHFTVADNGIGFDMSHAKRLFQPFQQLHGDASFGGTGIGLASVRRIIERHGGQIVAQAEAGVGAKFVFSLPSPARVMRRARRGSGV